MSPLDELFLVLGALYLFESAWRVPAAATLFVARTSGRIRVAHVELVAGRDFAWVHGPILRPFLPQFLAMPWTVALSPDGLVAYDGQLSDHALPCARAARLIPFAPGSAFLADAKRVVSGGQSVARFDTNDAAVDFARRLTELVRLEPAARDAAIHAWIAARLDFTAARARFDAFVKASRPLRFAVGALFVFLFVGAPIVAYRHGLAITGWGLLAGLVVALAAVVVTWTRAARRIKRMARRSGSPVGDFTSHGVSPALAMAVYPAGALRAVDLLARDLFVDFDPVAVALAAGDARTRDEVASAALHETTWPLHFPDRPAPVAAVEAWFRLAWERELLRELLDCGIEPASLLVAPPHASALDVSFCPHCRARYATPRPECADCEGVALVPFERDIAEE